MQVRIIYRLETDLKPNSSMSVLIEQKAIMAQICIHTSLFLVLLKSLSHLEMPELQGF